MGIVWLTAALATLPTPQASSSHGDRVADSCPRNATHATGKLITWDIRERNIVQEYDYHLSSVNSVTFVDGGRRFVSTSDDKKILIWEWGIPAPIKYISEP